MDKFILIDNHESFLDVDNGLTDIPVLTWIRGKDDYFYMTKYNKNYYSFFGGYFHPNIKKFCGSSCGNFLPKEILIDVGEYLRIENE